MRVSERYAAGRAGADGRSPSELQRDVESIMREMRETIQAIELKLSPRQIAAQARQSARALGRRSAGLARQAGRSLREHPAPPAIAGAGLLAGSLGVAALVRRRRRRDIGRLLERAVPAKLRRLPAGQRARYAGALAASLAVSGGEKARERIEAGFRHHPLSMAALCLVVGAAIRGLLAARRLRKERRLGAIAVS